jgi:hypothetical protein
MRQRNIPTCSGFYSQKRAKPDPSSAQDRRISGPPYPALCAQLATGSVRPPEPGLTLKPFERETIHGVKLTHRLATTCRSQKAQGGADTSFGGVGFAAIPH